MRPRWRHAIEVSIDFGGGLLCVGLVLGAVMLPVYGLGTTLLVFLLGPFAYAQSSMNAFASVGHALTALVFVSGPFLLARHAYRRKSGRLLFAAGALWALSGALTSGKFGPAYRAVMAAREAA
ncbi:MAG: hypothetical protein AAGC92_04055 [Pseudomonadota bacterium]